MFQLTLVLQSTKFMHTKLTLIEKLLCILSAWYTTLIKLSHTPKLYFLFTVATTACTGLQRLAQRTLFLLCNINDQCDTVHCNVTSDLVYRFVSTIGIRILSCNMPPSVWILGTDSSGSIVLNHVFNRSKNIPVIEGVTLNGSVFQLSDAIGFEVSVYAE